MWEPIATTCNILSNVVVLRAMCHDPRSPMPLGALALQVSANVSWVAYASLTRDWYLLTTASTSLCLQIVSCVLRGRSAPTRPKTHPIRLDTSQDGLLLPSSSPPP